MNSNTPDRRLVIISIPVLHVGGTEIQTFQLVKALMRAGYRTVVCCYYEYDPVVVSMFESLGAEVILMKLKRSDGLYLTAAALVKFFRRSRPDIVHVQYMAPGLVPIISARIAGVPLVFATVHQPGRTYGWKAGLLIRLALRMCNAFICNSQKVEESWFGSSHLFEPGMSLNPGGHVTIHNSVEADEIEAAAAYARRTGLLTAMGACGSPVIGVVSRLSREKGIDVLLDAMAIVLKKFPEALFLVAGDGPESAALKGQAVELGIAGHVMWLGQKDPKDVQRLYGVMDLLAVPSHLEGFGLSAAEAMAAGLPVVASEVDGLPELIVDNVTGLLVPPGDAGALALAIEQILGDEVQARQMGEKGRKRVRQLFEYEFFSNRITLLYKSLLGTGQAIG